jgi:hypothetical protein
VTGVEVAAGVAVGAGVAVLPPGDGGLGVGVLVLGALGVLVRGAPGVTLPAGLVVVVEPLIMMVVQLLRASATARLSVNCVSLPDFM